jgi:nicotinate-nucleotide pyrophosphorylase (carboxylating)
MKSGYDFVSRRAAALQALPEDLQHPTVLALIELSLAEDLFPSMELQADEEPAQHDLTSAAILQPEDQLSAKIFCKENGIVAGLPVAEAVFKFVDPQSEFLTQVSDGTQIAAGQVLALVSSSEIGLLAAERTALNFLGRMSGIATLTRAYVAAVDQTGAVILDTRKTAPGHRLLDKYAVRMGGGQNHRKGLYDMVLIKNNHVDRAGGIEQAISRVRDRYDDRYPIEVEVRTLEELETALALRPTSIMLDNMDLETMRRAVAFTAGRVPLEASGNVNLDTVRAIAETGVNTISVGALTHSVSVLDISMHILYK